MKTGMAPGPSEVLLQLIAASSGVGIQKNLHAEIVKGIFERHRSRKKNYVMKFKTVKEFTYLGDRVSEGG